MSDRSMAQSPVGPDDAVQHLSLASIASEWIVARILEGKIGPGQKITEDGLANQMGISRSPVREALRTLSRDGLVTIEPRRGVRVSDLGRQHAADLYACRLMIEPRCTGLAVEVLQPDRMAKVDMLFGRMRDAVDERNVEQYVAALKDFNRTLLDGCPNRILFGLAETMWRSSLRYWDLLVRGSDDYMDRSLRNNRAVYNAAMKRDAVKAEKMAAVVLERGSAELQKLLASFSPSPDQSESSPRRPLAAGRQDKTPPRS